MFNKKREKAVLLSKDRSGNFLNSKNKKLRYGRDIKVGDIIVAVRPEGRRHAGILGEDININGFLDEDDLVLHTLHTAIKYEPIHKVSHFKPGKKLKIVY